MNSNTQPSTCETNALTDCANASVLVVIYLYPNVTTPAGSYDVPFYQTCDFTDTCKHQNARITNKETWAILQYFKLVCMAAYLRLFVCVCLYGFSCPTREIFTHIETSPYRWRAATFELCSALMAIEQWRFFCVSHLLWHGVFVYIGHLRGPVTFTHISQ